MDIIIHTHGRANVRQQNTLKELNQDGITPIVLIQANEEEGWMPLVENFDFHLRTLPGHIRDLTSTRDFIIHDMEGADHVVFLDDDLTFARRRSDDPTKFRPCEPGDLREMFTTIDSTLTMYPMAGIGAREGGNRNVEPFLTNTRIMRVLAFRRSFLKDRALTFSPLKVMEDFNINLHILRSGGSNCVVNNWVSNQVGGSDAPGGCSLYRTDQVQTDSAHLLAKLHPGFVRVVEKTTKGAWGGKTRTDVVISWKKAYEAGQQL